MNKGNVTVVDLCIFLCGVWFGIQCFINDQPFLFQISLLGFFFQSARLLTNHKEKGTSQLLLLFLVILCFSFIIATDTVIQQLNFILYTNSSILGFQLALFAILLYWILQKSIKPAVYFFITLLGIAIMATLLTGSRGAIIALIAGGIFLNPQWKKLINRLKIKPAVISVLFVVIIATLFAITFKSDSTTGRSYIVQNSLTLFSNNLFTGVGVGGFNPAYNHTQADYFSTHSLTDKRALLANDGYFAFNEVLHTVVEQGIWGLIFLGFLLLITCREIYKINKAYSDKKLEVAILISIAVNSMVSYPLHDLLILSVCAWCLGSLSQRSQPIFHTNVKLYWGKTFLFLSSLATVYLGYHRYSNDALIKEAVSLKMDGYKMDALQILSDNKSRLIYNVNFAMPYLKLLYDTGQEKKAIDDFDKVHKYHCNQKMHKIIAKSYRETNDPINAEKHFLLSLHITPQLLQSRLDLANFYRTVGNDSLSIYWAQETIACPVKIYSSSVKLIRESAKKLLK